MDREILIGWRRLGCKILVQAYRDAAEGNGHSTDARRWLASGGAVDLVQLLELDRAGLESALAGLPAPAGEQLQLPALGVCTMFEKRHSDKA